MKIVTSCGKTFEMPVDELSDRQLKGLLDQNGDRTDVDPSDITALREELARRTAQTGVEDQVRATRRWWCRGQ